MPLLTIAIPAYNAEAYLARCLDSMLYPWADDVEIIVVNDGSKDGTAALADRYAAAHPQVSVIHKENGGHGSGINAGLAKATGKYFKVVDSDDWLSPRAFHAVLSYLRKLESYEREVDMVLTNFVYDKEGKALKRVQRYTRRLPVGKEFGWDGVKPFLPWEYLLMHSIMYRTQVLRDINLHVPEHCFYVDNYFAFVPLPHVKKMVYLDENLYHYYIGRGDQSVNEAVMITRIDQQIKVNLLMVENLAPVLGTLPPQLERYMTQYAADISLVTSVLLVREGSPESLAKKEEVWNRIRTISPEVYEKLRGTFLGRVSSIHTKPAHLLLRYGYDAARMVIGFN